MKNSEIAEGALGVLQGKGWTKGAYRNWHGYCLMGAAMSALGVEDQLLRSADCGESVKELNSFFFQVAETFRPVLLNENKGKLPWVFNDRETTTKKDVEQVLIDAAKYWRDRGE